MRDDAKNLQAIMAAVNKHNLSCPSPANAVAMNPFEIERLGWDDINGLPIIPDKELGTGVFRVLCDGTENDTKAEEQTEVVNAVSTERELVTV